MSRPVTATMAVQLLEALPHRFNPVKAVTIRSWANRGQIQTYGLDQYGLQQYELHDILRQASRTPAR